MTRRSIRACAVVFLVVAACHKEQVVPPAPLPPAPPIRTAREEELEKENARLRSERDAAQRAGLVMDDTIHEIETQLANVGELDTKARQLRNDIETGMNVQSRRERVGEMIQELKTLVATRRKFVARATRAAEAAKKKPPEFADAPARKRYEEQIKRLLKVIERQRSETASLTQDRDRYERLYREATVEVVVVTNRARELETRATEEEIRRKESETERNRVLVLFNRRDDLVGKKVLFGHFWHLQADCTNTALFQVADRRTDQSFEIDTHGAVHLYTPHPEGTYRFDRKRGKNTVLKILKPEFWSVSHCIVGGY